MHHRRGHRAKKDHHLGIVVVVFTLFGAFLYAYLYITDSETLAEIIRNEAPRYLPKVRIRMDRVMLRPFVGDVELRQTTLIQKIDDVDFASVSIPWLQVRSDVRSLFFGKAGTREVFIAQPRLRLRRRKDGSWNLQGLLANPWPKTKLPRPTVTISRGAIELADGGKPEPILSEVSLRIEPLDDGSYKFDGDGRGGRSL